MKTEGMKFPVDLLAHVSQEELERSAQNYMKTLLYSNPDFPESITLSDSTEVIINISTVGFVPLYGSNDKQKILALFSPTDPLTAVALYLLKRWWTFSDILKTEDNDRVGVVEVQTVGERIVLYSLNRVIYRAKEMSSEELPFLCHGETDYAKILWHNGEAVGFYSVKPSGSLWSSFSTRTYQLPVMDSIFVRKCHRGNDYGLQMLKDYVLSFNDSCLGLRYPLTTTMYKVCQKYLSQYPGDSHLLWEVQSIGGPNQRTNIANKIQVMDLNAVSKKLMYTDESDVVMEEKKEQITTIIKEADSVKCTVEILEEVMVVRAAKEADEVPVATWDRNDGSKQWKIGENITEDKKEKVIRIEDIEAESPEEEQGSEQQITEELNASEQVHNEDILSVATEDKTEVEYEEDSSTILDKTTTVQASEDLESESTVTPAAEECRVEDVCGLNNLYDSQIAIENVVSEIEEAQKKDSTEVLDVCKEAEMVEMERGAKNEAPEEELAEIVTQQVKDQSTCTTSAKDKAEKRGQTLVKTAHNEPPQQTHTEEEGGGRVLRGRTVVGTPVSKCKSTQQSQKAGKKLETEGSFPTEVDVLSGTEDQCGQDPTTVPVEDEIVTEINKKNEEAESSLILDEARESDEEEEPPVVQRRALRARAKATPPRKSTRYSKKRQKQQIKQTDDVELQEPASEEEMELQLQDQMEREDALNKPQTDMPATERNDVENTLEVNMEECKEVQEEEKTQELVDTEAVEGKEEEEAGFVIADVTDKYDSEADEAQNLPSVVSADTDEEPSQNNDGNSKIPKIMLVDIKTPCHYLQVNNAEETQTTKVSTAVTDEDIVLTTAATSEKENSISVVDQKELEPQQVDKVAVEEEETGEEGDCGKDTKNATELEDKQCLLSETSADNQEDSTGKNAQQSTPVGKDNEGMNLDKEEVPSDTITDIVGNNITTDVELCQEKEVADEATLDPNIPEEQSQAITEKVADKIADVLGEVLQDEEDVGEKKMTASEKEENEVDQTTAVDDSKAGAPENQNESAADSTLDNTNRDENIDTVEEQRSEIVTLQLADLPRLSVVLVDLKKSQHDDTKTATDEEKSTEEDEPAKETRTQEAEHIQTEETIAEEPQDNQEETMEETTAQKEDNKDSEADIETVENIVEQDANKDTVADESLDNIQTTDKVQATDEEEEAPPAETTVLDNDQKTMEDLQDEEEEEEKDTEEEKPVIEKRVLRSGKKCSATMSRRKYKRTCTQSQTGEDDTEDETPTTEKIQQQEEEAVSKETQEEMTEESEKTDAATQKEDNKESETEVEKEAVAEESVPEQDTVEETPAPQSVEDLPSTEEAETMDEEDIQDTKEDESTEEDEPETEARVLRSGRKSVSATPRRKSRRVRKQRKEKEERGPAASNVETQIEEMNTEQKHNREENMEEKEDLPTTDEAKITPEEDASRVETRILRSGQKTVKVTQDEQDIGEDESTEEDEQAVEVRTLRGGRKSISKTPKRKSKRARTQRRAEEKQETKEPVPSEDVQMDETIAEEIQDNEEGKTEEKEENEFTTENEEVEKEEALAEESHPEQDAEVEETPATQHLEDLPEEANDPDEEDVPHVETRTLGSGQKTVKATQDKQDTEEDKSTEEDEPAKETRVLRGGRKSASATPRRKSKRVRKQPETEEKEETADSEDIQIEETQDNQEEKTEDSEKTDAATPEEDTEETEIQKQTVVAEESLPEEDPVEETPPIQSVEDLPSTEEGKTTDEEDVVLSKRVLRSGQKTVKAPQDDQDTEEDRSTEEDEPVQETRVLRRGRKSASATPRRKSKRVRTQPQTEEKEVREDTVSAEEMQVDEISAEETQDNQEETMEVSTAQKEDNKDLEADIETVENIVEQDANKDTVADESLDNIQTTDKVQATDEEEEAPAAETTVLDNDQKTMEALQDEEEEEEKDTEEEKPVIEKRVLRSGKKCSAKISRRKYKRTCTQSQTEEDDTEDETPTTEKIQQEEEEAVSKETQEEMTEDSEKTDAVTQKEDNKESETEVEKEAVAEESVPEQDTVEETPAPQSVEDLPSTEEAETMDEEDIVLSRSSNKTVKAPQDDQDTEEDRSTEEDEPVQETRVLRRGRKSASATPRRKSKRVRKQPETEEKEDTEKGAHSEDIQGEETVAEETQDNQEEKTEDGLKDEIEEGTSPIEKIQLEEAISEDTQDNKEEMIEDSEKDDTATEKEDNKELETEVEKEAVAEESVPEQDTVEEAPAIQSVEDLPSTEEAETMDEEDIQDTEEDKSTEEDEPAKETRVLRRGRKSASATPRRKSKRVRKQPETKEKEETEETTDSEDIQIDETQDNQEEKTEDRLKDEATTEKEDDGESGTEEAVAKSIPKTDQIEEEREDEINEEGKNQSIMTEFEITNEKGDDLNLELDTDEEGETASLNVDKEDEQSMSEEEEQVVIRGKVLRGRKVPSVIITPKHRQHSPRVQKAQESSSDRDPEHKPKRRQSAERAQKRKSSGITPRRRSKRHRI